MFVVFKYTLTHFFSMFPFDPFEKVRKPNDFSCFQGGGVKRNIGKKRIIGDHNHKKVLGRQNGLVLLKTGAKLKIAAFQREQMFSLLSYYCWLNKLQDSLTHFIPLVLFYTPWYQQKTRAFLFSVGIEKDLLYEMGW